MPVRDALRRQLQRARIRRAQRGGARRQGQQRIRRRRQRSRQDQDGGQAMDSQTRALQARENAAGRAMDRATDVQTRPSRRPEDADGRPQSEPSGTRAGERQADRRVARGARANRADALISSPTGRSVEPADTSRQTERRSQQAGRQAAAGRETSVSAPADALRSPTGQTAGAADASRQTERQTQRTVREAGGQRGDSFQRPRQAAAQAEQESQRVEPAQEARSPQGAEIESQLGPRPAPGTETDTSALEQSESANLQAQQQVLNAAQSVVFQNLAPRQRQQQRQQDDSGPIEDVVAGVTSAIVADPRPASTFSAEQRQAIGQSVASPVGGAVQSVIDAAPTVDFGDIGTIRIQRPFGGAAAVGGGRGPTARIDPERQIRAAQRAGRAVGRAAGDLVPEGIPASNTLETGVESVVGGVASAPAGAGRLGVEAVETAGALANDPSQITGVAQQVAGTAAGTAQFAVENPVRFGGQALGGAIVGGAGSRAILGRSRVGAAGGTGGSAATTSGSVLQRVTGFRRGVNEAIPNQVPEVNVRRAPDSGPVRVSPGVRIQAARATSRAADVARGDVDLRGRLPDREEITGRLREGAENTATRVRTGAQNASRQVGQTVDDVTTRTISRGAEAGRRIAFGDPQAGGPLGFDIPTRTRRGVNQLQREGRIAQRTVVETARGGVSSLRSAPRQIAEEARVAQRSGQLGVRDVRNRVRNVPSVARQEARFAQRSVAESAGEIRTAGVAAARDTSRQVAQDAGIVGQSVQLGARDLTNRIADVRSTAASEAAFVRRSASEIREIPEAVAERGRIGLRNAGRDAVRAQRSVRFGTDDITSGLRSVPGAVKQDIAIGRRSAGEVQADIGGVGTALREEGARARRSVTGGIEGIRSGLSTAQTGAVRDAARVRNTVTATGGSGSFLKDITAGARQDAAIAGRSVSELGEPIGDARRGELESADRFGGNVGLVFEDLRFADQTRGPGRIGSALASRAQTAASVPGRTVSTVRDALNDYTVSIEPRRPVRVGVNDADINPDAGGNLDEIFNSDEVVPISLDDPAEPNAFRPDDLGPDARSIGGLQTRGGGQQAIARTQVIGRAPETGPRTRPRPRSLDNRGPALGGGLSTVTGAEISQAQAVRPTELAAVPDLRTQATQQQITQPERVVDTEQRPGVVPATQVGPQETPGAGVGQPPAFAAGLDPGQRIGPALDQRAPPAVTTTPDVALDPQQPAATTGAPAASGPPRNPRRPEFEFPEADSPEPQEQNGIGTFENLRINPVSSEPLEDIAADLDGLDDLIGGGL